jgi:hypothetical protein
MWSVSAKEVEWEVALLDMAYHSLSVRGHGLPGRAGSFRARCS